MGRSVGPLIGISVLEVLLVSCGNDCAGIASCIPEWAVIVALSGAPDGGPVNDAVVRVSGAVSGTIPCNTQGNETTCWVSGSGGTYTLEVSAPGFQSAQRTVRVQDAMGECGCLIVATQRLAVSLVKSS